MRFAKTGNTYQLRIETAEDLKGVLELDESLWVATSAPRDVFRCAPKFLELVDTDANGRIWTIELKQAIRWLFERLADTSRLRDGTETLPLSAIRSDTPESQAVGHSARYILDGLGEDSSESISLAQVRRFAADMLSRPLNGDGIVRPDAAADPATAGFIRDVMACVGNVKGVGGLDGINEGHVGQFMEAVNDYLHWLDEAEMPASQGSTTLMPLGPATPDAYSVFQAHAEKVDLFFTQCRVARFEPRTAVRMSAQEPGPEGPDLSRTEGVETYLHQIPLAKPSPDGTLRLVGEAVNPAYRNWVAAMRRQVLRPILGGEPDNLSEADWERVKSILAPYGAYLGRKGGAEVENLLTDKLKQYRDGHFAQNVQQLIEADKEVAAVFAGVGEVERLLLYHQNLMRLARNFVSFPELYSTDKRALFEMGSAVIDGRWFNFAVRTEDVVAHSIVSKTSQIFVMYLEITGTGGENFHVAVPATWGTKGNLNVGKRGVFFDTEGKLHDARIVRIVKNPISLREALAAPFTHLWGFLLGKIEALSGAPEKDLQAGLAKAASAAKSAPAGAQPAAAPAAAAPGGHAGLVVAISVAIAALGSAFAYVMDKLAGMETSHIVLGLAVAALLVLLPVSLIAIIKLRRQDLSALLEGCGWAINASMKLTRAQRRHFTSCAAYPADAEGGPPRTWVRIVIIIVFLAALVAGAYYGARELACRWGKPDNTPGSLVVNGDEPGAEPTGEETVPEPPQQAVQEGAKGAAPLQGQ